MDGLINKAELPQGWKWVKLNDIGRVISGGTPSTTNPSYWSDEISWITPADLSGYSEKFISKGKKSISKKGLENSSAKLLPKGSVLFSSRAPIGYVVIASNELATNQGFKNITPCRDVDSNFLYYYLKASKQLAEKSASGTTFKEISGTKFGELPFPLPPLPEQHAIVSKIEELLSELDKGKQQLETAQQQLKVYRQAVLKWAFEGKLSESMSESEFSGLQNEQNGNALKSNSVESSHSVNSDSDNLPKGWKWVKLGEITTNFDGKRIPLSRDIRAKRKGEFRYYGATEVVDYIDEYIFDGTYLLIGEDGANLLTKSRPLAFIAEGKFWVNNHAHVLQAKENLKLKYLTNYFNSINLRQYVTGSAQPKLTQANLNKIPVPLPPIEEQHLIVQQIESRLSVCDKVEETINQSLAQAETLRQSILKKAFEGRLL